MNKILILTCGVLMMSSVVLGDDTTTETCANGVGTVITGAVSGHKYCTHVTSMTWWNAYAWCDGMGRRLFSLDDCEYSVTGTTACADLQGLKSGEYIVWTANPHGKETAYVVNLLTGGIFSTEHNNWRVRTLCY